MDKPLLIFFGVAYFLVTFIELFCGSMDAMGQPVALVEVDMVQMEELKQTFPVLGRFVMDRQGVVAVRISAPVEEVLVDIGDRVKAGDTIARLVPTVFRLTVELHAARIEASEAEVEEAQADLVLYQQQLSRLEELRSSVSFSRARYDDLKQSVARAKANLQEIQRNLSVAKIEHALARVGLENTIIKAPYSGMIIEKHTEKGAYLNTGMPIVSLLDDSDLELEADVSVSLLEGLETGIRVQFRVGEDEGYEAMLRAEIPDEDPRTRTRVLRFTPVGRLDEEKTFANNQSVRIHLPIGRQREVLSVHKDALIHQPGSIFVFVVKENKVEMQTVELGKALGGRIEVLSGLQIGDVVVVRGNERLQPGQAVVYSER